MLQSNKTGFVIILLLFAFLAPIIAEPVTVYLERGPVLQQGLPFLPLNVISYFEAEYVVREIAILCFQTQTEVVLDEQWQLWNCLEYEKDLQYLKTDSGLIFAAMAEEKAGSLFFTVYTRKSGLDQGASQPGTALPEYFCQFIQAFTKKLNDFYTFTGEDPVPPFPAVLNLDF